MPKLLLINPALRDDINVGTEISFMRLPPLNLGYLAAMTPRDWEIKIIDENIKHYTAKALILLASPQLLIMRQGHMNWQQNSGEKKSLLSWAEFMLQRSQVRQNDLSILY